MTDAERVEQIYHKSSPDMLTPEGWQFLIKMARIGASVMPRPISEAPKDELALVYSDLCGGQWDVLFFDPTETSDYPWKTRDGQEGYHKDLPTHWVPLSALPKPNEVTT